MLKSITANFCKMINKSIDIRNNMKLLFIVNSDNKVGFIKVEVKQSKVGLKLILNDYLQ